MNKKLLLADDDPNVRRMLSRALGADYEVSLACDGEEALARASRGAPDLLVLDVGMPKIDGHRVCMRLRGAAATRTLPILMLSAQDRCADKVAGLSLGADDYMTKPFDVRELLARVKRLLERDSACRNADAPTRPPSEGLAESTFLFTDLNGSSALYESLGDVEASSLVWAHLDLLIRETAAHAGSLVKTMGDAIMAVFPSSRDAVLAGVGMQRAVRDLFKSVGSYPAPLKVGIHGGPAIVRRRGDGSDYFGSAVNIASRLCGQCRGGDIVFSDALLSAELIQTLALESGCRARRFMASLKGFPGPSVLWRIDPAPDPSPLASSAALAA